MLTWLNLKLCLLRARRDSAGTFNELLARPACMVVWEDASTGSDEPQNVRRASSSMDKISAATRAALQAAGSAAHARTSCKPAASSRDSSAKRSSNAMDKISAATLAAVAQAGQASGGRYSLKFPSSFKPNSDEARACTGPRAVAWSESTVVRGRWRRRACGLWSRSES
eukprot:3582679-Prymnesium_polylepis.1